MTGDDVTGGRCVSRVSHAVILSGPALRVALDALLIAMRTRKLNGLPISARHRELARALAEAVSADGQTDVCRTPALQPSVERPTVMVGR